MHGPTNIEIVNKVKSSILIRAGHVVRMDENELSKKVRGQNLVVIEDVANRNQDDWTG